MKNKRQQKESSVLLQTKFDPWVQVSRNPHLRSTRAAIWELGLYSEMQDNLRFIATISHHIIQLVQNA